MRKALVHKSLAFAAALSFTALAHSPARAQSTAFTYQGSLDDAGAPTSGLHDFRFRLFDVASGGSPLGSTLCVDNVNVVEGVFTVREARGAGLATGIVATVGVQDGRSLPQISLHVGADNAPAPRCTRRP